MRILRLNRAFVAAPQDPHDGPQAKQMLYACNVLGTWFHGHNKFWQKHQWLREIRRRLR